MEIRSRRSDPRAKAIAGWWFRCQLANSTVLDLSFLQVQWWQTVTRFPVIVACELVSLESACSFSCDSRRTVRLASSVQQGCNAFANLRYRHRWSYFFSPVEFRERETNRRSMTTFDDDAKHASSELDSPPNQLRFYPI